MLRRSEKTYRKKWDPLCSCKYERESDVWRGDLVEGFPTWGRTMTKNPLLHHASSTVLGLHEVWMEECAKPTSEAMKTPAQ